jgi:hypothetical protein
VCLAGKNDIFAQTLNQNLGPWFDVVFTIFGDFCQFSAKNLAVVSKTYVMIEIFHKLHICSFSKNVNFFSPNFSAELFLKS